MVVDKLVEMIDAIGIDQLLTDLWEAEKRVLEREMRDTKDKEVKEQ